MRRAAILLPLVASLACGAEEADMQQTLTLPRSLRPGGSAFLEVQVGPLAPGQRIRVTTSAGEPVGAISPFGPAARRNTGVYSLPVPPEAIRDNTLSVRVTVLDANNPPRAPTAAEVQGLRLVTQNPAEPR